MLVLLCLISKIARTSHLLRKIADWIIAFITKPCMEGLPVSVPPIASFPYQLLAKLKTGGVGLDRRVDLTLN